MTDLKRHSMSLFQLLSAGYCSLWGDFKKDLKKLACSLSSYAVFLEMSNAELQARQCLDHPVRQVLEDAWLQHIPAAEEVANRYADLDSVCSLENYEYLYLDESIYVPSQFKTTYDRHAFLQNVKLSVPTDMLRYNPGGAVDATVFLWRVPEDRGQDIVMNEALRVVNKLKPRLPEYHTRKMRKHFTETYCNIHKVPPHILRSMYTELTSDVTAEQNPAMDNRLKQAIISEDPDLVVDLRHLNKGRPNDTFEQFFNLLNTKVDDIVAANERRHSIEHLAKYISIRDLIDCVKKDFPAEAPIPSESTVLFSFSPKNSYIKTARLYKSRVPLQFKVQTRQLRVSHMDEHYCAAQFRYLRCYAQKHKTESNLLCIDDNAKIDFGEPGQTITSGVRGRKSIVPVSSQLSALDHDMQSLGCITPSVCLKVAIPEEQDGSFYRGEVSVTFKDSIFQPSNPWRHAAEIESMLKSENPESDVKPILLLFSDGGPDHRVTYHSVKLSLIVLFKKLDLDLLVAGRTAPGHSWLNPCERIMSLINLGLQNVSLTRSECSSDMEQVLRVCNSMADVRKKAEKVHGLKDDWMQAVHPIVDILEDRMKRLALKDEPFTCPNPAANENVDEFENEVKLIDETIVKGKYQKKDVASKPGYKLFLERHCLERQYIFQIRKCDVETCCKPRRSLEPNLSWVPDPVIGTEDGMHYNPFFEVIGKDTTEKDRPSATNKTVAAVAEELQGVKNSVLVGQNVRKTVVCYECNKPRCIYAKKTLSIRNTRALCRLIECHDYACGSLLTPDVFHLFI